MVKGLLPDIQGQNMALNFLFVPSSLNSDSKSQPPTICNATLKHGLLSSHPQNRTLPRVFTMHSRRIGVYSRDVYSRVSKMFVSALPSLHLQNATTCTTPSTLPHAHASHPSYVSSTQMQRYGIHSNQYGARPFLDISREGCSHIAGFGVFNRKGSND